MKQIKLEENIVTRNIESAIKIALVFLIIYTCFLIVKPFLLSVVWAIIIAVAFYPLHKGLTKLLRNKGNLSATVVTVLSLALLIIPTVLFMGSLVESIKELAEKFTAGTFFIPPPPEDVKGWPLVGKPVSDIWQLFSTNITEGIEKFSPQIQSAGEWLLGSVAGLVGSVFVFVFAIIIAGLFLANSDAGYKVALTVFNTLVGEKGTEMVDNTKATISSVVKGVLGVALIQSTLIAMGFFIAGVPGAPILSLIVFFLTIVQLPPTLVVLPVVIYMFSVMSSTGAIVFAVWNVIAGFSDTFLKPILLGRGVKIPMLIILIGSIGGMLLLGIIGLFIGAVVLALGYQLFQEWVVDELEENEELLEVAESKENVS